MFGFVDESVENIINLFPDVGSEVKEFPVDSVKRRLQKVSFSGVLRVEEVEQLKNKLLVYKLFGYTRLEIWRLHKSVNQYA